METVPEPLAGLIRDHRLVNEVVSAAREVIERASR